MILKKQGSQRLWPASKRPSALRQNLDTIVMRQSSIRDIVNTYRKDVIREIEQALANSVLSSRFVRSSQMKRIGVALILVRRANTIAGKVAAEQ